MASSSSSEHHRQQRPAPLVRHNSSFLGTIKNIVTAPLNWFAHQDELDDSTSGKRRRPVENAPTELVLPVAGNSLGGRGDDEEVDEATRRSKRMRLHSPPRTTLPYLDPPVAALHRSHPTRRSTVVPRASSAVLPSSRASRATLSPHRHPPIARTMSIDPPYLTARRETPSSSAFNFAPSSSDMDMVVDNVRDVSMPPSPLSPRPSFRMRSSLTPQPQHPPARHISEPPPLNALISNPVFLHPPAQKHEPSPPPTLGSLVESARATQSPVRQNHSSLLFASNASVVDNENKDAPAERALHQLDVYKTPLLPTRMRSSNLPASITSKTTPDMFKSRRSSHLILMPDDRDRLGRKVSGSGKSPVVNETKPYAGEGGMKKLLARHKLEAEAEQEEADHKIKEAQSVEEHTPHPRQPSPSISVPPPPAGSDWFSTAAASSTSASGSSLRVGRTKTSRNHIQRPSRARFSAVYEEETDDAMEEEDSRQKERQMLEDAAKKVPVFQMPAGFSFAKATPPVKPADLEIAKEPPISFLPFSFSKPAAPSVQTSASPSESSKQDTILKPPAVSIFAAPSSSTLAAPVPSARVPETKAAAPTPAPASFISLAPAPAPAPAAPSGGGIPNFFADSQVLKEISLSAPPPVLSFQPTTSPFSLGAPPSAPVQPVNDTENPFWDGDKKKAADVSKPLFGGTTSAPPPLSKPAAEPAQVPFSFGKPSEDKPVASAFSATMTTEPHKQPFSFGALPEVKKPETECPAPQFLFGGSNGTNSLFGEAPKPAPSIFGAPVPPQSSPSPLPFTFGAPTSETSASSSAEPPKPTFDAAASTTAPSLEAPKPLFGGSTFSFGQPAVADKDKEIKTSPFSFGAAPSTPPAPPIPEIKPVPSSAQAPVFSFGRSPTSAPASAPAPLAFGFSGGGSATSDVSNKQPFMFGQSSNMAPPARPVTPPKNNDQEFRMEESPTREMQLNSKLELRPTIGGPFSFGSGSSTSGGSLFGGQSSSQLQATTPFSFGASAVSNPFAPKDTKPEEPKGFAGFGQAANAPPPISTTFSFGQRANAPEEARPSSAGTFTFGTPNSAPAPNPSFSFGAPTNTNPFGQPAPGSAPSSPSTFNQPSSFGFGAPGPTASTPFSFGSQPASPAESANLTLPQTTGFGNGGGFGQSVSPSSPFNAPIPLAPSTSSGGSLFTIGAAPPPSLTGGGPRQIKKLPRRGGVKR